MHSEDQISQPIMDTPLPFISSSDVSTLEPSSDQVSATTITAAAAIAAPSNKQHSLQNRQRKVIQIKQSQVIASPSCSNDVTQAKFVPPIQFLQADKRMPAQTGGIDESGMNELQKQKLLQIIQKQQREQHEFEKLNPFGCSPTHFRQRLSKKEGITSTLNYVSMQKLNIRPVQVLVSPPLKKQSGSIMRGLMKKYKRNPSISVEKREEIKVSNEVQQHYSTNEIPICFSPIKRSTNGIARDERFTAESSEINHSTSDWNFYKDVIDSDDMKFFEEIEAMCCSSQQESQIFDQVQQQVHSSIQECTAAPIETSSSSNSVCEMKKDFVKTKKEQKMASSPLRKTVRPSSLRVLLEGIEEIIPSGISQNLRWPNHSNNNNNNNHKLESEQINTISGLSTTTSEFLQQLETEDSLVSMQVIATTQTGTPQSCNNTHGWISNLFSPEKSLLPPIVSQNH